MRLSFVGVFYLLSASIGAPCVIAQQHEHGDHGETALPIERPKVFLDKSPRIVQYQLGRLDNQRLLLVERKTDDIKYAPVYAEILSRVGMSPQYREEALAALVSLRESDPVSVLVDAIGGTDPDDPTQRRTARQLSAMLVRQSPAMLAQRKPGLNEAIDSGHGQLRAAGYAALVVAKQVPAVIDRAQQDNQSTLDLLSSISMIPQADRSGILREVIVGLIENSNSDRVRRAAITAIGFFPQSGNDTFRMIAPLVADGKLRDAAVPTLLKVANADRDSQTSGQIAAQLVDYAEQTPAEDRTSDKFVDAMQLVDQLLARLPTEQARAFRGRLAEITVRVIRIKTVEEEMRYDTSYFAVEAGRPVQIVLENHDLMPHNLVLTVPGGLKEVAQLGLQVGPHDGWQGLQYVPESDKVLHATQMVPADEQVRLTFTAPDQPGEYPYVCTFPQHWYRMYGVMVVVDDLDQWLKHPVEPANPIGSNRSFVKNWQLEDLKGELENGLRGRSDEIGKKLFAEASCIGCHKVSGEGGLIGPELTDLFSRWKDDRVGILREILEPSHKVDAKYVMQRVLTVDGRTLAGILVKEDDDQVTLLTNPESTEPTVLAQDDIDAMVPSSVSMMPKALLDQYTKDEILEILGYLQGVDPGR